MNDEGLCEYREAFWALMEEEQPTEVPCRPYKPLPPTKKDTSNESATSYSPTEV